MIKHLMLWRAPWPEDVLSYLVDDCGKHIEVHRKEVENFTLMSAGVCDSYWTKAAGNELFCAAKMEFLMQP